MGVVALATSPTPLSAVRRLRFALEHLGAERRSVDCLPQHELPAAGGVRTSPVDVMGARVVADLEIARRRDAGERDFLHARLDFRVGPGRLGERCGRHGRKSQRQNECAHFNLPVCGCASAVSPI